MRSREVFIYKYSVSKVVSSNKRGKLPPLTKILMNVNRSIVNRVSDQVDELARRCIPSGTRRLCPGVAAGEAIAGGQDELPGTDGANGVDSCLK